MKVLKLASGEWRYDETKPLGDPGGFAAVYAGLSADDTPVAIKIFHRGMNQNASRELEFALSRRGKAASHIVTIHDGGVDATAGKPAIVMAKGEYSLSHYSKKQGPISEAKACAIGRDIVDGLLEVSAWVHRDLKPANVIWCAGRWQLVDFGIARIADAATAVGTMKGYLSAQYAAPEQWNNERATHATDVYALGCIIHELLTGKPLFNGTSTTDLARQHRMETPRISAVSPALQSLLFGMLAKPQVTRPTLEELRRRLHAFAEIEGPTQRPKSGLSAVSAVVSAEQAEREVAAAKMRADQHTRLQLRDHGLAVLKDLQKELFERIRDEAPAAAIRNTGHVSAPVMEVTLGHGTLTMSTGHKRDVPREVFSGSKWNVICWDHIQCSNPGYQRSASLWYVDDGSGRWRWLEAAYYCWARATGMHEPCSLPPGRDADLAASSTMSSWSFAHPPYAIEEGGGEAFFSRWINHLVQAAQGQLRRPSSLPEA